MADEDTLNQPDPPRDPQADVPLTRADIPELMKAVVAAVAKTTGTPNPPGKLPVIASGARYAWTRSTISKGGQWYLVRAN